MKPLALFLSVSLLLPVLPAFADRTSEDASTPFLKPTSVKSRSAPGKYDLLLIGDSITRRWMRGYAVNKQFAPWKVLDLGYEGEHTENILFRLQNGELEGVSAKVVMLLIGTNNIGHTKDQPEWIANGVKKIIETVQSKIPGSKVLVMGIFPRGEFLIDPKTGKTSPTRTRITETNKLLAGLADGKTIAFVDVGDKFVDKDGVLNKAIFPDVLHPTTEGYKVWYEGAKPKLDELMEGVPKP